MSEGYQQSVEMVPYGQRAGPPWVEGENPMMANPEMQHQEIQDQALSAQDSQNLKAEESKHKMSMTWKIIFGICGVIFVLGIIMVVLGVGKTLGKSLGKSGSTFFNDLVYVGLAAIIGPMLFAAGKWAVNKYKESKKDKKDKGQDKEPSQNREPSQENEPQENQPQETQPQETQPSQENQLARVSDLRVVTSDVYPVPMLEDVIESAE